MITLTETAIKAVDRHQGGRNPGFGVPDTGHRRRLFRPANRVGACTSCQMASMTIGGIQQLVGWACTHAHHPGLEIEMHAHDDLGLATANTPRGGPGRRHPPQRHGERLGGTGGQLHETRGLTS